jgi:MFS superfamily sulfate permease-like transporter
MGACYSTERDGAVAENPWNQAGSGGFRSAAHRARAPRRLDARSKTSAIVYGILLLTSMVLGSNIINLIPLSALAAILFVVG